MNSNIPFDIWRLVGANNAFIWNVLVRAIPGLHDDTDVSAMKAQHMGHVIHEWEDIRITIPALNGRIHTNGEYVQYLGPNETVHICASGGVIHRDDGLPAITHRLIVSNAETVRQVYAINGRLDKYANYTRIPIASIVTVGYTDNSDEIVRTEQLTLRNSTVDWIRRVVGERPVKIRDDYVHGLDIFSVNINNLSQYVTGEMKPMRGIQAKYGYQTNKYNESLKNVAKLIFA